MLLIPQILFEQPQVETILRDGNVCILSKTLTEPVVKRAGYISNHVISIVLAGRQEIRPLDAEAPISIPAGEAVCIPRGMYYVSDFLPQKGAFKSLLFYFDDALIQKFLANSKVSAVSRAAVPDHLKFGVVPSLSIFADSLLAIYQSNQLSNTHFLHLKILEVLYLLNSLVKEQDFANFLFRLTLPKKRNIKAFMAENFQKPLKIEDYAYLTGRSPSTFRRDFKAFFDSTPQKWLKEKRLEKALLLLDKKAMSVSELALAVGYENTSYFIKEFKGKVGLSPKQYLLAKHRNQLNN